MQLIEVNMTQDLKDIDTGALLKELMKRWKRHVSQATTNGINGVGKAVYSVATSKFVKKCLQESKKNVHTPKKGKIAGVLIGLALVAGGVKIILGESDKENTKTQNQKFYKQANENLKSIKINSRADFDKITKIALGELPMTWFTHEACVKGPYSDTGNTNDPDNSYGFGIYNDPNFDMQKVYDLCKSSKKYSAVLVDNLMSFYIKSTLDWFDKQYGGKFWDNMYECLQGCEVSPTQVTAFLSIFYNNPAKGFKAMDKFKKEGAMACASFILDMKCNPKFQKGIDRRRIIEIALLFNNQELLESLPRFTVRSYTDDKDIEHCCVGNASLFSEADIAKVKDELRTGDVTTFNKLISKYCKEGVTGNGATLAKTLIKNAPLYALDIFRYPDTLTYQAYAEEITACAAEYYTNAQDSEGMEEFAKKLSDMNVAGIAPEDINLNLAAVNMRTGNFDKCIDYCVKVFENTDDPAARYEASILEVVCHLNTGKLREAEICLDRANHLKDKLPEGYLSNNQKVTITMNNNTRQ